MSSWRELIHKDTAVWRGVTEYAQERLQELTAICVCSDSTEIQIRQAQQGMQELHRLIDLPTTIATETRIRQALPRKEY